MNKEVKQSKIKLSDIHSVMQKELDWKTRSQSLDQLFSDRDARELAMIKHQEWEEIEGFISQAVESNHPKVKGPGLYRRLRRKQGRVNRMIIQAQSRFLELLKAIDKRLQKIEIIPLNSNRHRDETNMQSNTIVRATEELKSEIKNMRQRLNLLEEEINKIEKSRPPSETPPANQA